ncbi:hypothetical protein E5161_16490 [Cohnella pontilimi]|uniref:Uncharacterized protein n=1 Tax=Cohnella pontilimi TaxID=2564100 RepID=A0A4U0F7S7_9BACL|nr:hypothetical protein [Cohnella pontilimi]TJY40745.1 hypothetical protein E5161_16490 [Cohnella pontilimi]
MRITLCIVILFIGILSGCTEDKPTIAQELKNPDLSRIQSENKALHDQVIQLQEQLQATQQKYNDLQMSVQSSMAAQQPLATQYPDIADLTSVPQLQKIEIRDAKGSKTITDPDLLNSVSNLFVIKDTAPLGSPPIADIEPVDYLLTTANGTVKVSLVKMGIVSFDDLYPGEIYRVENDAYQLAKAFMSRPSYLGKESTVEKMVNSGLLKVDDKYDVWAAGRIRLIALAFYDAHKTEIKKPKTLSQARMKMTFYYFGKEIQMNLYDGKVEIQDGTLEQWFDLKPEDIEQIRAGFSAA